jgi:PRC-barrel domain
MTMPSSQASPLESRETHSLIGSDKVEGTPVYRSNGERVGTVTRVMIDKVSGKVAYAVMSFGGFLGIGEDYYPLPWSALTYNERLGGYEFNVTEEQLKNAPRYAQNENWDWNDQTRTQQVDTYYIAIL